MDKKWKTSIAGIIDLPAGRQGGEAHIHGYKVTDLIDQVNFTDAILISTIDNGLSPPSITNARNSASSGNPMQAAVAAGVLGVGESHGGAIEECARLLQMGLAADKLVEKVLSSGERIPGFGHKVYTTDPRATQIFAKAKDLGFF